MILRRSGCSVAEVFWYGLLASSPQPPYESCISQDDEHPLTRDELHAKTMRGLAKRDASTARKGKQVGRGAGIR